MRARCTSNDRGCLPLSISNAPRAIQYSTLPVNDRVYFKAPHKEKRNGKITFNYGK